MLEVIVQNGKDAELASKYGADRLEVVSAISEGGLTPSYGAIKEIIRATEVPAMMMIRPHSYSFVYSASDQQAMRRDIELAGELGVAGIVFGALTAEGEIDTTLLEQVIDWKGELKLTFHRAIESAKDIEAAYKTLRIYGEKIDQVLTSGGTASAANSIPRLKSWISDSLANPDSFEILVGSGVTDHNIAELHAALHNSQYHVGSGARRESRFDEQLDAERIKRIKHVIEA